MTEWVPVFCSICHFRIDLLILGINLSLKTKYGVKSLKNNSDRFHKKTFRGIKPLS